MKNRPKVLPTEQALCTLLKYSLFNIPYQLQDDLDWEQLLEEAKAQTVEGLILPKTNAWKNASSYRLANNMRIMYVEQDMLALLQGNSITVSIIKGTAAAVYYPVPLKRTMGDIDFIVPQEQFSEAVDILCRNDYHMVQSFPAESSRHAGFIKNGVKLELHHHFSYNDLDIENYIIKGLQNIETASINGMVFPMLPKMANGLVLLAHMREHLKDGLGLRQVIDWMMYVDKVLNDEFWNGGFQSVAAQKGLETLAKTTARMCQLYLGLTDEIMWCKDSDELICDKLFTMIFSLGNFGRKNAGANVVEFVSTRIRNMGLLRYLQSAGEVNWPAYHKYSCLKPFCWVYQLCRLIYKGIQTKRGFLASQDIVNSKERYELLKDLGVLQ